MPLLLAVSELLLQVVTVSFGGAPLSLRCGERLLRSDQLGLEVLRLLFVLARRNHKILARLTSVFKIAAVVLDGSLLDKLVC